MAFVSTWTQNDEFEGLRSLCLGCGPGRFSDSATAEWSEVHAVQLSLEAIKLSAHAVRSLCSESPRMAKILVDG